jgi:hypothetical protein
MQILIGLADSKSDADPSEREVKSGEYKSEPECSRDPWRGAHLTWPNFSLVGDP